MPSARTPRVQTPRTSPRDSATGPTQPSQATQPDKRAGSDPPGPWPPDRVPSRERSRPLPSPLGSGRTGKAVAGIDPIGGCNSAGSLPPNAGPPPQRSRKNRPSAEIPPGPRRRQSRFGRNGPNTNSSPVSYLYESIPPPVLRKRPLCWRSPPARAVLRARWHLPWLESGAWIAALDGKEHRKTKHYPPCFQAESRNEEQGGRPSRPTTAGVAAGLATSSAPDT